MRHLLSRGLPALLLCSPAAVAAAPPPVSWQVDARLRHETVSDDAFARDSEATTLRVRAGLKFRVSGRFDAFVEGEGVASLQDRYDSTANGRSGYPVVADPEGVELNQAWLAWRGDAVTATLGRQRLQLDGQRWISNVGWRQNEQTFDAAHLVWKPAAPVAVTYAWLDRVHRVNGDRARNVLLRERDLDTHLLHAAWTTGVNRLSGYALLHDDQDVASASTATYGARYARAPGKESRWGLTVDAARQVDHAGNPASFGLDYWLVEPAFKAGAVTLRAGWEHLGSDGRRAVQAPLGLLHAYNGWADRFTATPPAGLEDRYLSASGALAPAKLEWQVAWHDYRADVGSTRYGTEWNASLARPFGASLKGLVKVADYRADGLGRDATKLWLQLEWTAKGPAVR